MTNPAEVFNGVYRIQLPLPYELASVNVHLIRLDPGWMLIDCGMQIDGCFSNLEQGLSEIGITWTDIRQILLTHTHPDHMGLCAKVLHLTGAQLLMHEEELRQLALVNTPERRSTWIDRAFIESGVPGPVQEKMQQHFQAIRSNFHPIVPDRILQGGEFLETAIGPLEVLWTPGHSPGHVCLYSSEHRLFISGDQILPKITPNIAWLPDRDPLGDYIESLRHLSRLDVDLIVPSHGRPFTGHRSWIDNTIHHHEERCGEIRRLLECSPGTGHELVGKIWTREMSAINQQFALLEVLAHLEFMRRRGEAYSESADQVVLWSC